MQKLIALPVVLLAITWFTYVVQDELNDPHGMKLTYPSWIWVSRYLKFATIVAIIVMLRRSFRDLHGSRARSIRVAKLWASSAVAFLVVASLTREWWAPLLSNQTTTLYSQSVELPWVLPHWLRWRWYWSHGIVTIAESFTIVAIVITNVAIGYRWGGTLISVGAAMAVAIATGFVYVLGSGWVLMDFDLFIGDIVVSSLLLDTLVPIGVGSANTSISTVAYLATTFVLMYTIQKAPNWDVPDKQLGDDETPVGDRLPGVIVSSMTDSKNPYSPPSQN